MKPSTWLVRTLLISIFISLFVSFFSIVISEDWGLSIFIFLLSNLLIIILMLLNVYYASMQKLEDIDEYLPDYLDNVAGYITAGFPPVLALKTGLREEFGILTKVLNSAVIKALGSTPAEEEILKATSELGSEKLQRILTIFMTSYISGGKAGTMLERFARDLRQTNSLKQKLITGVNVYVMFISISLVLILPLIMAVSMSFLSLTSGFTDTQIDLNSIVFMSVLMLTLTSMFTGMFVGIVKYGHELMGFKHSIILALASNMMLMAYHFFIIPLFFG